VIAVDPATAHAITHEPPPPAARAELERRWQMGSGIKAHAIYDRPWWRDLGLSGTAVTDTGTTRVTFDVSPTNAGVLTAFIGLPLIDDPSLLDPDATTRRRRQVLDDLAAFYGPSARQPDDYVEKDWATEPWHSGCLPRPPTGLLSRYNRG
jgi:monoamine oxidase